MIPPVAEERIEVAFERSRPRWVRLAYRMLGSMADAEDVVQEAFLRWLDADRERVREPEAFLYRIVMRLCLDHLRSARKRRETYIGPWLPDPVTEQWDEVIDVTLPLMLAMERLSPLERAAFLLHDVFGHDFKEVATIIGRRPDACRQLAHRARVHVRGPHARSRMSKEQGQRIASAFFAASRNGDMAQLRSLFAKDVHATADGGGKVRASERPIVGIEEVIALHASLAEGFAGSMSRLLYEGPINGLPGFITVEQGGILQATAIEIRHGRITAIYVMRNPDKLGHIRMGMWKWLSYATRSPHPLIAPVTSDTP